MKVDFSVDQDDQNQDRTLLILIHLNLCLVVNRQ